MLELNKWFFVQLINFLALIVLLNYILFKPLLRLFKERESLTRGFLDNAKAMDEDKDRVIAQIEAKLSEARNQANTIFEALGREGMEIQKQILESAQKDASELNRKAKEDLEASVKKARETLKSDVEAFSRKIVEKMVEV